MAAQSHEDIKHLWATHKEKGYHKGLVFVYQPLLAEFFGLTFIF